MTYPKGYPTWENLFPAFVLPAWKHLGEITGKTPEQLYQFWIRGYSMVAAEQEIQQWQKVGNTEVIENEKAHP